MKIQTAIITIAIVLMVIVSVTAPGTLSFAVRTNSSTHSQSTTPTARVPSQITTTTVAHNATTLTSDTNPCSSGTVNYLWNHVYGKTRTNGTKTLYRFYDYNQCITVTGRVLSDPGVGTKKEPDGDLHFTLHLDPQYAKYSNENDPKGCLFKNETQTSCHNIIVEVICHQTPTKTYTDTFGPYCDGVRNVYPQNELPAKYDKLSVSGKWVKDIDETVPLGQRHLAWNEIHPATNIHKIS